jgi:putative oxidoreductase
MTELTSDLALTVVRVAVGLVLAGHGAQKLFGAFQGPGLERWHGAVASMGFAQPRLMATLAAFVEFFGGLMLAVGFLTPVLAAALAIDLIVAIVKVHWSKGMWVTKGGYEYALVLFVVLVMLGLARPGPYSADAVLGFGGGALLFLVVLVVGGVVTAASGMAAHGARRTA